MQTKLLPGQSERDDAMPLEAFADEVLQLLDNQPTPKEILVKKVAFLRDAEAEGRFDAAVVALAHY